jgi:hypothetical protein
MMGVKTVFTIVLFVALLGGILLGLGSSELQYQTGTLTNQSNVNLTLVNTGLSNVRVCDYHSDIPIIGGLIWGADCIGDTVGVMFSIASTTSDNILLGAIFTAIAITLILVGVMLLRGNGII